MASVSGAMQVSDDRRGMPAGPQDELPVKAADQAQLAGYIAHMTGELSAMCKKGDLELLAYFLDMARVEALTVVNRD